MADWITSMEVTGAYDGLRDFEGRDFLGLNVNNAVLILDRASDLKKSAAGNDHAFALEKVWRNDDVSNSCLVFE